MATLTVDKVYNAYALFYNQVFGRVFHPGRTSSIGIINNDADHGSSILELGVGTGLSLPLYRADLHITGIDIAANMLKKAQKLAKSPKVQAQVNLQLMNAEHLAFADNSFDYVLALYVASVVSDLDSFLAEICRVCKPRGKIIIVNHFSSSNIILKRMEQYLGLIHTVLGFKSDFPIEPIINHPEIEVLECRNTNIFGYWKLLHCQLP